MAEPNETASEPIPEPATILSYRAKFRLHIGKGYREPGQLVPEAHTWFRRDAWLHHGRIAEVKITPDELREAIARYCPELYAHVARSSGLDPSVMLTGPRRTPVVRPKAKPRSRVRRLPASKAV